MRVFQEKSTNYRGGHQAYPCNSCEEISAVRALVVYLSFGLRKFFCNKASYLVLERKKTQAPAMSQGLWKDSWATIAINRATE